MERVGGILFGRRLRLRVAFWVLDWLEQDRGPFYQTQAALGVEYSASSVAQELDRLIDLGMVTPLETTSGASRRSYFLPLPHPLWDVIRVAREAIDQIEAETTSSAATCSTISS